MPIDGLISPLRYDIVIRQQFFELLVEHRAEAAREPSAFLRRASEHPYFIWFREIVFPRPAYAGRDLGSAFAERVGAARELLASFELNGLDRHEPIVLRTGSTIEPTLTGKRIGAAVFAGDGCHRIALLRMHGAKVLTPDTYVLERRRRFTPLDNTARLLPLIPMSEGDYYEYLSLAYGGGESARSREELLELAGREGRRREAIEAIEVDGPLVRGLGRCES